MKKWYVELDNRFIEICMHSITSGFDLFKYFTALDFAYCLLILTDEVGSNM
jgi:hypothetical protein